MKLFVKPHNDWRIRSEKSQRIATTFAVVFVLCFCFSSSSMAALYSIPTSKQQPYDNIPITAKTWEEIDIAWDNKFNSNEPNTAKLLRPITYVKYHHLVIHKLARLHMQRMGIPDDKAIVVAIRELSNKNVNNIENKSEPVIGYFKHETNDVKAYYFIDSKYHISKINATPNHPFYVRQLKTFKPIGKISSYMTLVGRRGVSIHLICFHHEKKHCGISHYFHAPVLVYNIEVYRKHVYLVGRANILVHNKGFRIKAKLAFGGAADKSDIMDLISTHFSDTLDYETLMTQVRTNNFNFDNGYDYYNTLGNRVNIPPLLRKALVSYDEAIKLSSNPSPESHEHIYRLRSIGRKYPPKLARGMTQEEEINQQEFFEAIRSADKYFNSPEQKIEAVVTARHYGLKRQFFSALSSCARGKYCAGMFYVDYLR